MVAHQREVVQHFVLNNCKHKRSVNIMKKNCSHTYLIHLIKRYPVYLIVLNRQGYICYGLAITQSPTTPINNSTILLDSLKKK